MDGGIGATTAAIGEAVSQTAATGVETIGKTTIESVSSTIETVGLDSLTGPEVAEPILHDALANGTDDAFKNLAEMDLSELPERESLSQAEAQESKIIPLTEQHDEVPVSEVIAAEEDGEETDSEETEMEPGEIIDLAARRNKKETEEKDENEEETDQQPEELTDEQKERKKTLDFLAKNPDVLDALKNIDTLTKEQRDRAIKKIKEAIAEEKDGKKMNFLEMLLAIFVGEVVNFFADESNHLAHAA